MSVFDDNFELTKLLCSTCTSSSEILKEMGLTKNGAMYSQLKEWSIRYNITLPQYKRQFPRGGNDILSRFVEHSTLGNKQAKEYLISVLGWEELCVGIDCLNPTPMWAGKPLKLQLDHTNGISNDFRLENLRFLCPNCHSQTETFGSKNRKANNPNYKCDCGNRKATQSKSCKECTNRSFLGKGSKINWPETNELIERIKLTNYSAVAKELNVSDNSIRQHLRRRGIDPKTLSPLRENRTPGTS